MDGREQVLELIKNPKRGVDVCGALYSVLKQEESQSAQLLQFFCENAVSIPSSKAPEPSEFFTDGELLDLTKRYGVIVKGILKDILFEKPSKEEFYSKLWEKLTLKGLFEDEKAQIFALYYAWMDNRLPYFELPDTIHIEQGEYREIAERLFREEQKAQFIMAYGFKQWTEVSNLLLELLDEVSDKKERAVLFSCIFQMRERMLLRKLALTSAESE